MPKDPLEKFLVTVEVEVEAINLLEAISAVEDACVSYKKADIELIHSEGEPKF